jgi:predicted amidohydrolase YtcJ
MEPSQLLIQNASVIDGTGAKPRKASVLVVGDTIKAVGKAADAAAAPTCPTSRRQLA